MQLSVQQGTIQDTTADTLIVNLFDDVTTPSGATGAVDKALSGAITTLIASGDLNGKAGEVGIIYPRGMLAAKRVLIVGLGARDGFDLEGVRRAAAAAMHQALAHKAVHVATIAHGAGIAGLDATAAAQATFEGALLAAYRINAMKQEETPPHAITSLTLVEFDADKLGALEDGMQTAVAIAAGNILARDLVNLPPNYATPSRMAETARQIARDHDLEVLIGGRRWARKQKMGAFLAVAKGAGEKPKFIVLEHNAGRSDLPTIVLVGKGITFDTGGISIKPAANMGAMKGDMGGAAAVLGAIKAVAMLDLPLHVVGITPCTENMPDADAYRPADVITAGNGKTIEIISTDAEGRMALADALVYAQRYSPDAVIDLATLTGSSIVALGKGVAASLFSNDDALRDRLVAAGTAVHERVWPMPLWRDYRETIQSDVADMKNSGGRDGGVGTAAVFLQEFVDYSWAHVDMAGLELNDKASGYTPRGASGFGVRLLVEALRSWNSS